MDANYMPHFEINKMYVTSSEVEYESEIIKIYQDELIRIVQLREADGANSRDYLQVYTGKNYENLA